jgi:hypothetical protein
MFIDFASHHWVYWAGPYTGSILAAGLYKLLKVLEFEKANPGQDAVLSKLVTVMKAEFEIDCLNKQGVQKEGQQFLACAGSRRQRYTRFDASSCESQDFG